MRKKAWIPPKLVVLIRPRPEEAVLQVCKFVALDGPDADNCFLANVGVPGENCTGIVPS